MSAAAVVLTLDWCLLFRPGEAFLVAFDVREVGDLVSHWYMDGGRKVLVRMRPQSSWGRSDKKRAASKSAAAGAARAPEPEPEPEPEPKLEDEETRALQPGPDPRIRTQVHFAPITA